MSLQADVSDIAHPDLIASGDLKRLQLVDPRTLLVKRFRGLTEMFHRLCLLLSSFSFSRAHSNLGSFAIRAYHFLSEPTYRLKCCRHFLGWDRIVHPCIVTVVRRLVGNASGDASNNPYRTMLEI